MEPEEGGLGEHIGFLPHYQVHLSPPAVLLSSPERGFGKRVGVLIGVFTGQGSLGGGRSRGVVEGIYGLEGLRGVEGRLRGYRRGGGEALALLIFLVRVLQERLGATEVVGTRLHLHLSHHPQLPLFPLLLSSLSLSCRSAVKQHLLFSQCGSINKHKEAFARLYDGSYQFLLFNSPPAPSVSWSGRGTQAPNQTAPPAFKLHITGHDRHINLSQIVVL